MPLNKGTGPEKREPSPYFEKRPKKDDSAIKRELGKKAVQGASKDKPKK